MKSRSSYRPHVYQAINQIVRAFSKAGIPKRHTNATDQYQYRSIDDVLERLGPLLARCGLCVLPRALSRESEDRAGDGGAMIVSVRLLVAFDLVSARDGSRHVIQAWGEALDHGDKGTAKAMSAAFKGAMQQLFCIPNASADAESSSFRLKAHQIPEPVEGWACWSGGIIDMIGACASEEALDRVRSRQANLLGALSREKPELYTMIGNCFSGRRDMLGAKKPATPNASGPSHPANVKTKASLNARILPIPETENANA